MTVKELIKELSLLDQNKEIKIQNSDGYTYSCNVYTIKNAYVRDKKSILEFDEPLTNDDIENSSKEDLRFIVTNKSCYIIKLC